MSVYIHDIGIPKTGYVDVRLFSDGRATTQTGERPFYREMKIEEVPEKHGRLIDADELRASLRESIEECRKWADEVGIDTMMYARISQAVGTFAECSLRAKAAPTIIQAEDGET